MCLVHEPHSEEPENRLEYGAILTTLCSLMSIHRTLPLLATLVLTAIPAPAQASTDSVTISEESIKELRTAIPAADESLDGLNEATGRSTEVQSPADEPDPQTGLGSVLFVFLAIAVVFEAAMSAIFDWRVFLRYFEGRGVKTPLLVGVAFLVCSEYDLDILSKILVALDQGGSPKTVGKVVTALLISGGSSAVFRVYSNLGIRNPAERDRRAREERKDLEEIQEEPRSKESSGASS
jgi:hypothetical protein